MARKKPDLIGLDEVASDNEKNIFENLKEQLREEILDEIKEKGGQPVENKQTKSTLDVFIEGKAKPQKREPHYVLLSPKVSKILNHLARLNLDNPDSKRNSQKSKIVNLILEERFKEEGLWDKF